MSKYKLGICCFGLTLGCLAAINGAIRPILAEEGEMAKTQSLANSFSTNATDLTFDYHLAQAIRDLEKFCTNYPYNSQCRDRPQPNTEVETRPSPESTSSQTGVPKTGWAIVPEISTLGLGGSVVRRITPSFNARAGVNAFGLGFDIKDTDATYEADLNLFNVSTLVDYHPIKSSGLRLSGGLIFGNNTVEGTATPTLEGGEETITIGNQRFNVNELVSVDADFDITNSVSPYLGLGWGNPVFGNKGLGFWANLGVVFGGSPEVNLTPNLAANVSNEVEQAINEAVARETKELEDEIAFISVYPVVSLGLSYQF
ncbi:MAG: hypothetical protein ACFCU5_19620 [Pleurocapsa sp.]